MGRLEPFFWAALSCAVAVCTLGACGGEDAGPSSDGPTLAEPTDAVEATDDFAARAPAPGHGGGVVAVGRTFVEVLAHDDGLVEAFPSEPASPPGRTQVTVHVPADDGAIHPVALTWDPDARAYRGRLVEVRPVPGPVEVVILVGGEEARGSAPRIVLAAPVAPSPRAARPTVARPRAGATEASEAEVDEPTSVEAPAPPPPAPVAVIQPIAPVIAARPVATVRPIPPRETVVIRRRATVPAVVAPAEDDAPAPEPRPRGVRIRQ